MRARNIKIAIGAGAFLSWGVSANAVPLYANNPGKGLQIYDSTDGTPTSSFVPSFFGRGIVVVGDIIYYTEANSGSVYSYNLTSKSSSTAFSVAGASGLGSIAYDGASLYLGDYSGTNQVYKYSLSGTLETTIKLSLCTGYCDGLEYANGKLISNRTDGGYGLASTYDVYDLNGNVLQAKFITTTYGAAGIAYDGTDYYVSDIIYGKIDVYGPAGGDTPIKVLTLKNPPNSVEDLSFDYAARSDTGGGGGTSIPEPGSITMMLMGLVGLAAVKVSSRSKGRPNKK